MARAVAPPAAQGAHDEAAGQGSLHHERGELTADPLESIVVSLGRPTIPLVDSYTIYHVGVTASGPSSTGTGFLRETEGLGALPVLEHYWGRLGLSGWLSRAVCDGDGRSRLSPAKALRVAITNICIHHEPVYALGKWAKDHDPKVMGLDDNDVSYLNDDRVGLALSRLFDADRANLLNDLVVKAVGEFDVDCSRLHNDSTSVATPMARSGRFFFL